MIDISIDATGELRAGQRDAKPSVYLDHWALLDFSEDERLADRLTTALETHNGTLMLSWLNLGEYSKITNQEQARKAEALVEKNIPRLYFIEIEPFRVIDRENKLLAGGSPEPPHGDGSLLRELVHLKPASTTSVYPFTAHNLFTYTQDQELAGKFGDLADVVIDRIAIMRNEVATDQVFESMVRRLPSGPQFQHGTRYIIREFLRGLLLNEDMKITRNHAVDLLHAVVPVAYCDFVLLDRHWETQVAQMRARLTAAKMAFPIANVYSRKANGIERFLSDLESTVRSRNAPSSG